MIRALVVAIFLLCGLAAFGQPARDQISIQQVQVIPPLYRLYVDLIDSKGAALPAVAPEQVAIGGPGDFKIQSVRRLEPSEGIAYIVLVDVSRSTKAREREMTEVLQRWIRELTANEQMAIVTFGNDAKIRQDFTSRQADLLAVADIQTNDQRTHLYAAFNKAIELSRRLDPGLPVRRAIVVLSDGQNDEKETGLTEDDIARTAGAAGIPIFAVDSGPARDGQRRFCSKTLARLATVSSGYCERLGQRSIADSFTSLRTAIRRVFVVEANCALCPVDGQPKEIWVELRQGAAVQRSAVRLVVASPSKQPAPSTTADQAEAARQRALDEKRRSDDEQRRLFLIVGAVVLLLLISLVVWWRMRMRKRNIPPAIKEDPPSPSPPPLSPHPHGDPPQPILQEPKAMLEFVVVGGGRLAKTYEVPLRTTVLLGRGSECQIRLDDEEIAEAQCEFSWVNDRVYVRDVSPSSATFVGGGRLRVPRPIETEETIRVGRTELRILIRPI